MSAYKVAVIGAGAVGAALAQRVVESGIADVVLIDVLKDMARGKAMDISDASCIVGHERSIEASGDLAAIKGSGIIAMTAGFARRPGMTREDLIAKNAGIVRTVSGEIRKHAPDSIVIVVTNPLDVMTYLALHATGMPRNRVFGMAGLLDSSRMSYQIANALGVERSKVKTLVLGSHGDTMVPVISMASVDGRPLESAMAKDAVDSIIKRTRDRGAEIVSCLGTGSAYSSPSAAVHKMIESILKDLKEEIVASVCLDGEYGLKDICIGVPCVIGKDGIGRIVEIDLTPVERELFMKSADAIRKSIQAL